MINDAVRGYFGFERLPFDRSVPVGALFASASHQEAAGRIAYGIDTRQITVITGEVGAGKTVAAHRHPQPAGRRERHSSRGRGGPGRGAPRPPRHLDPAGR
jgi:type II secretory pathway predicted ATPase ExeA